MLYSGKFGCLVVDGGAGVTKFVGGEIGWERASPLRAGGLSDGGLRVSLLLRSVVLGWGDGG